jgi:BrnA antitoxin of type II toxin-antitoxin system
MRFYSDVITWLKADGRGYQTKANRLLRRAFCEGSRHGSASLSVRSDEAFLSRICYPQVFHNIRRLYV